LNRYSVHVSPVTSQPAVRARATAAMSHLSIEFPIATFQANVEGTVHLFESARLSGVKRIVYFSMG
jgi:nucleoside-diphosphate-sugar epimerase